MSIILKKTSIISVVDLTYPLHNLKKTSMLGKPNLLITYWQFGEANTEGKQISRYIFA